MTVSNVQRTFSNRRVLVTGHTGFKGSWLCEWLLSLGADVTGYALDPPTEPSLFELLQLSGRINDVRGDVRDLAALQKLAQNLKPDFVFHLAAQPLVRYSYQQPLETWEVNVMGTGNLLEALRSSGSPCAAVIITTDKCYENREWEFGYRETDPMGGADPYSSSKGMAELLVRSWRSSFAAEAKIRVATARAGNVIGGGDWARDRILPDCIRSLAEHSPIQIRNPHARRPWQHVLDPLGGYLQLATTLDIRLPDDPAITNACSAFNFGPPMDSNRTVAEVVEQLLLHIPGSWISAEQEPAVHEASLLHLSIDRAAMQLNWTPTWDFPTALARTADWYREYLQNGNLRLFTQQQIMEFQTEKSA